MSQAVELGRRGPVRLSGGYRLRIDAADFLEGDRTDRRNGVLIARTTVTTRELTTAQLHEVFVAGTVTRDLGPSWQFRLTGELAPAAVSRLAIELPDKYPGQTLVYRTTTGFAGARIEIGQPNRRWPVTVAAAVGGSWSYHPRQWAKRRVAGLGVMVSRAW
jgi:hypothetical protein